jgi:hypothetical protein
MKSAVMSIEYAMQRAEGYIDPGSEGLGIRVAGREFTGLRKLGGMIENQITLGSGIEKGVLNRSCI